MHVVVHPYIGVQLVVIREQRLAQSVEVARAVFDIKKAGQAVVAALHDVLRNAGQFQANLSGHVRMVDRAVDGTKRLDRPAPHRIFASLRVVK